LPHPDLESLASKQRYERFRQDADVWRLMREMNARRRLGPPRPAILLGAVFRALRNAVREALDRMQHPRPQTPLEQHWQP